MTEFRVVSGVKDEFEKLVTAALSEGWQLQGNATMVPVPDRGYDPIYDHWYTQALTREKAAE